MGLKRVGSIYHSLRTRWGLTRFVVLIIPAILVYTTVKQSPNYYTNLLNEDGIFLFILASISLLLITAYSSFSKIFKFRVFFLGHLFTGTTLLYLYLTRFAFSNPDSPLAISNIPQNEEAIAVRILLMIVSINTLATIFAPTTLRHRNSRLLSWMIVIAETAILFISLKNFDNFSSGSALFLSGEGFIRSIVILNTGAFLLSFLGLKEDNSFGGAVAAIAVINMLTGISLVSSIPAIGHALFVCLPALISVAIILYWFSCLHHRVAYDPLMKIYNRDYAHHIVSGFANVSLGNNYVVAMVDVDHFKSVNDTYGHQAGDAVLFAVAQRIRTLAMPRGIACRYGGEEIVIFLRNTKEADAYSICEAIRREIRRIKHRSGDREFAVTVSIGMTECDEPQVPVDRVLKAADEALYQAKETGRNKVLIGRLKKRVHIPDRPTYVSMQKAGHERRHVAVQE